MTKITDERLAELIEHFNLGHRLTLGDDRWATSTHAALRELRVLRRAGGIVQETYDRWQCGCSFRAAVIRAERELGGGA